MSLAVFEVSPRLAMHVAMAVRRYRDDLRRAGKHEPDGLIGIEQAMVQAARSGQERPGAASVGQPDHSGLRDREYFSPSEVVSVTGLSERTVRRHLSDGSLPSTQVGRARRVARLDLEQFMRSRAALPAESVR